MKSGRTNILHSPVKASISYLIELLIRPTIICKRTLQRQFEIHPLMLALPNFWKFSKASGVTAISKNSNKAVWSTFEY